MKQRPSEPELFIEVQATPNELIAVNLAITYYLRHCRLVSPVYEEASQLLEGFQRRCSERQPWDTKQS